jgi:hypothetical protein
MEQRVEWDRICELAEIQDYSDDPVCRFADFPVDCASPRPQALRLIQRPGRPGGPRYDRLESLRYLVARTFLSAVSPTFLSAALRHVPKRFGSPGGPAGLEARGTAGRNACATS